MKLIRVISFISFLISALILLNLSGCQSQDEIRFKKYMSIGKQSYQNRCQHCHGDKGQGLGKLYPPLDGSDYLIKNREQLACIVRYGQQGEIFVNGIQYNQVMPGNPDLLPDEIAPLLTYIMNAWSNDAGLISKAEVEKGLESCEE